MPKRAAKGDGMIRQRPDGRWEARYTAGTDPGTGKQIQKSIYGKTQDEVRRKLKEITKDIDDVIYFDAGKTTVAMWMKTWLDVYCLNLKDTTHKSYDDNINLHIIPRLGAMKLSKLTPTHIQKFYSELMESGRLYAKDRKVDENSPKGLSGKTVKNIHNILHKALKQATKPPHNLLKYNPADAVELPRTTQKEMSILSTDETAALIKSLEGDWHYPIFLLTIFCGLRRGESIGVAWSDVNFENNTILIRQQVQRERKKGGLLKLVPLKNNKSRMVYPPDCVFTALDEHKKIQDSIKNDSASWEYPDIVFVNAKGGLLEASAVYRSLIKHLEKINITGIRMHDLRHTFATTALSQGIDIKTLQELLGHGDPGFTLRAYGHSPDIIKKQAASKINALANSILNTKDANNAKSKDENAV